MAIRVGIVGLGMMGTTHFRGYGQIEGAEVVAVCDVSGRKLSGDWAGAAGNIDTGAAAVQDLSALKTYDDFGCDCIIATQHVGCQSICGARGLLREVCRNRDIPLLFIEFDYNDDRVLSPAQMRVQIEEFFTTVME